MLVGGDETPQSSCENLTGCLGFYHRSKRDMFFVNNHLFKKRCATAMILLSDHVVMFCGLGIRNDDNHHVCCIPFNGLKDSWCSMWCCLTLAWQLDGLLGRGFKHPFFVYPYIPGEMIQFDLWISFQIGWFNLVSDRWFSQCSLGCHCLPPFQDLSVSSMYKQGITCNHRVYNMS